MRKQVSIQRALIDAHRHTHSLVSYIIYSVIHSDDKVDTLLKKARTGKMLFCRTCSK